MRLSNVVKFIETESKMAGEGNGEMLFIGYRVSVFQDKKGWRWLCSRVSILNTTELYT